MAVECVTIAEELVSSPRESVWLASMRHRDLHLFNHMYHVLSLNMILRRGFFFFFPEWLNFKCSVLSQSVGPVLGWVSPEGNLDMRVHMCVAYLEGGLCQHLRGVWASEAGTERLETVRKERIPQNVL